MWSNQSVFFKTVLNSTFLIQKLTTEEPKNGPLPALFLALNAHNSVRCSFYSVIPNGSAITALETTLRGQPWVGQERKFCQATSRAAITETWPERVMSI